MHFQRHKSIDNAIAFTFYPCVCLFYDGIEMINKISFDFPFLSFDFPFSKTAPVISGQYSNANANLQMQLKKGKCFLNFR